VHFLFSSVFIFNGSGIVASAILGRCGMKVVSGGILFAKGCNLPASVATLDVLFAGLRWH